MGCPLKVGKAIVLPMPQQITNVPQTEPWRPSLGYPQDPNHPFNKQWDIFNSRKRILLVCGSRKSGKTYGVLHRIARHLWETPGARVGVFAKSIKLAKEGGTWQDFLDYTLPEWCGSGMATQDGTDTFRITTLDKHGEPGCIQDSVTRTQYVKLRNYWGGESEIRLFSIDHDQEVASKVKNKSFSMIYFIELSMFKDKRVLTVTLPSMRMPHLRPRNDEPDTNHQWIADANPDEELGNRSWFYDVWYKERIKPDHKYPRFQSSLGLIEMFSADNPYCTKQELEELEASCDGDQALYDSYVLGIHGDGGQKRNRHFAQFFIPKVHIIGENNETIAISPNTDTLRCGWDMGSSVNHAAGINEKRIVRIRGTDVIVWNKIDELVTLREDITIGEFAIEFLAKMDAIEKEYGRKFEWIHYSDDTAMNVMRATTASFDYLEVLAATDGRITLTGVEKAPGSVRSRVALLRRLLRENRYFIGARCVKTRLMIEECKKGDTATEFVMQDEHKHVFDETTYPIIAESAEDLEAAASSRPNARKTQGSEIISVG